MFYNLHYSLQGLQASGQTGESGVVPGNRDLGSPCDSPTAPSPSRSPNRPPYWPSDLQCPGPQVPYATQHDRPVPCPDQVPAQAVLSPEDAVLAQDHWPAHLSPGRSSPPWRKRMGEYVRQYNPRRGPNQCSKCKKPKVAPSHRQYFGNWYCEETTGESYEDWAQRMYLKGYTSRKRRQPPPDEEDPTADPP